MRLPGPLANGNILVVKVVLGFKFETEKLQAIQGLAMEVLVFRSCRHEVFPSNGTPGSLKAVRILSMAG